MDIDATATVQNDGEKSEEELKAKAIELENKMQKIMRQHEQIVADLTTKFENKQKECEFVNNKMEKLVKEDGKRKAEIKKLKEENQKIAMEIGQLQFDNDKVEAEVKARGKLSKMKENTKLFNRIIEKQLDDGIIKNVDINKYKAKEDDMEECGGGFVNESLDLDRLRRDKQKGGRRISHKKILR